jgi:hypothetical protein
LNANTNFLKDKRYSELLPVAASNDDEDDEA